MTLRWLALVLVLVPATATAASFTLTPTEQQAAIRTGERSITLDAWDAEWRVANGRGETVEVLTPFHRLALAARHAAFRQEPLKPSEQERLLKEEQGRLLLRVGLRGRSPAFARYYQPRLVVGDREIKATFVQNEHTAARQESGEYLARCFWGFPLRELTRTAKVALVVADSDGRDIDRFAIDLARMR